MFKNVPWMGSLLAGGVLQVTESPELVMGTNTLIRVVVHAGDEALARQAIQEAELELRRLEQKLSRWLPDSDIARFNASPSGSVTPLQPETRLVVQHAIDACARTGGTFDSSAFPLVQLWQSCECEDRQPSREELDAVREATGWQGIELTDEGLRKTHPRAGIDLGGIGKGYGVDRAIARMQELGVLGALVQCGGDTRVFGRSERDRIWRVGLHDPLAEDETSIPDTMYLRAGSVSTSGDYERFVFIGGEQLSHILDPRTGQPIQNVPQTTVIGAQAVETDVWSTALSILGEAGLDQLPPSMNAHMILREDGRVRFRQTEGFSAYLAEH